MRATATVGSGALGRDAAALRVGLRLQRAGWVACALFAGVVAMGTAASFPSVIGTTPEQRLASARQLAQLARPISVLLPIPDQVETLGGYVQWRVFGGLPFVVAGVGAAGRDHGHPRGGAAGAAGAVAGDRD
jgi:hypothetical protein